MPGWIAGNPGLDKNLCANHNQEEHQLLEGVLNGQLH